MTKTKTIFICQECGMQSPRWVGKCSACGSWNSYAEEEVAAKSAKASETLYKDDPVLLNDILFEGEQRTPTAIGEFDRVTGGGVVEGSVTLIGGDPGIGKSTLALQVSCTLSEKGKKVLYVSGEESVQQTRMRAERLTSKLNENLFIVNQVDLANILKYIRELKPDAVIVDSIQVVYHSDISSTPGTVSQVRECAAQLTQLAKTQKISLFIIGHVTKEGMIAGPRVLEHIVDTVLYFEGERYSTYRILRATKNRFGSTNEIGVFEMASTGLEEVKNPSEIFLAERPKDVSGSVVVPTVEGTRPLLVEVQGLVSRSSFGMVRQKAQGFDANRLALLIAVLEKKLDLNFQDKDVFLNVVGGVRIVDPAADLAVCLAIASALLDKPLGYETVALGEVGLSSEVRSISQIVNRLNEAQKLGFKQAIVPKNNMKAKMDFKPGNLKLIPVGNVREALDQLK